MNAAEFNALYEVGVPVFAYPGCRPEDFPNDRRLVTRTRSKASVLGGHTDVVWVDDHSACIALSHIDVVSEDEWKAAKTAEVEAVPSPVATTSDRLTPEREAEIAEHLAATENWSIGNLAARDLLAELTAVRAERDELGEWKRRVTEEVEEFEDAAKDDPQTPRVACLMIANLRRAMRGEIR